MLRIRTRVLAAMAAVALSCVAGQATAQTNQQALGERLYFDTNLSEPAGQSCASCHAPGSGFADPEQNIPVSAGVRPGSFGRRNAPSASYAVFAPRFTTKGGAKGGQFWDGRAATLAEQAKAPFLNPQEMANTSRAQVIGKIAQSLYAQLFRTVCGTTAFSPSKVDAAYNCMAAAIAAFEGTTAFRPFTSKFDAVKAGRATFTAEELLGETLFTDRGKCTTCHVLGSRNAPTLFTDFKYHNLGLPSNQEIFTLTSSSFTDLGLGAVLNDPLQHGRFKTPHLRNVALTAPYMHNGVLKTLKDVVHFYNTRDVAGLWPLPEVPQNREVVFMGNLGLSDAEEGALVAFMRTLSDGWFVP